MRQIALDHPDWHCIPEVATIVLGQAGILPSAVGQRAFQSTLRSVQVSFEEASIFQAAKTEKSLILLDRGTLDSAAFCGMDMYNEVSGTNLMTEYDRYDAVIMLGLPKREVYEENCKNNPVRTETYDQALAVDVALVNVWQGHHNFVYLGDYPTWQEKYEALVSKIKEIKG